MGGLIKLAWKRKPGDQLEALLHSPDEDLTDVMQMGRNGRIQGVFWSLSIKNLEMI